MENILFHRIGANRTKLADSTHWNTKCVGAGHSYAPRNFKLPWATKELDSSNKLEIHEPSRKKTQKHVYLTYHPYYRLCNLAHTRPNMLLLHQKIKLIEFSGLQPFDVRSTPGGKIQIFPWRCISLSGLMVPYTGFFPPKVNNKIAPTRCRSKLKT